VSRHQLDPRPAYPHHNIVIGWDAPLRTFYVQITHHNAPDDEPIGPGTGNPHVWLGSDHEDIPDAADAIAAVRPYAEIPAGLLAALKAEQAAAPGPGEQIWQVRLTDWPGDHH
jgi:hypothetical protein